jgi:hypothetical protein
VTAALGRLWKLILLLLRRLAVLLLRRLVVLLLRRLAFLPSVADKTCSSTDPADG